MSHTEASKHQLAYIPRQEIGLLGYMRKHIWLYVFLIPGFAYLMVFKYVPMFGIIIAFKDFSIVRGIWESSWIGFENFAYLFESNSFYRVLRNSLVLSFYQIAFGFPAPILLAVMLNEVRSLMFKKVSQTILYLPFFISWVVLAGMIINFLSPSTGPINHLLKDFGMNPISFLLEPDYFRSIIVLAEIWKGVGWGTIIYLAAMAGIDPSLYEAAKMDGASRTQQIRHITLPGIYSTIVVLLILQTGSVLENGFEQIFLLYSPPTYDVADVFETYTYRVGLIDGRLSFAAAVGFFKAAVGLVLIIIANRIARLFGNHIW